jgi:hypothetical protein
MRAQQFQKRQVCDHCGGSFGMVTHRWWGNKFCKQACKDIYITVALKRGAIRFLPLVAGLPLKRRAAGVSAHCVQ